ncbi:hypothetical protein DPEC_G00322090 [Dallia pectoralis]|uniref:Uncharacterized protein n=1 Tax=Dallia pectoralis TaxID=75939 RepID=A0ACC2FAL1_DALPE|nr:hypothetical protein DPEC_G00322090 [Dallia pectoralis]
MENAVPCREDKFSGQGSFFTGLSPVGHVTPAGAVIFHELTVLAAGPWEESSWLGSGPRGTATSSITAGHLTHTHPVVRPRGTQGPQHSPAAAGQMNCLTPPETQLSS